MDAKRMDVSRFLLFEATGDSEADAIMDEQSAGDDDDAESRSPGGSETCDWDLADQNLGVADADHQHCDGNKNDDDEEETVVYGRSYCDDDDDEVEKRKHRSKLSVDSGHKLMDETEKNRRFWEACLAS